MQKQIHLLFSGRVQGVGFRFRALNLARRQGIKGWVKNLPDRRVELVAQGSSQDLTIFLSDLKQEFLGQITNCSQTEEKGASDNYADFQILF